MVVDDTGGTGKPGDSGADGRPSPDARPGVAALLLMGIIRTYQLTLSAFLGRHCRHLPTCSAYAMEAVRRHGAWAGFWLGFFRVMRCHPLGTHGVDPVPVEGVPRRDPCFWRYRRFGACRSACDDDGKGKGQSGRTGD